MSLEDPHEIDGDRSVAPPRSFWFSLVPGVAMMLFGLDGLLRATDAPARWSIARWYVGGNLAQDLVVAPIVCLVGFLTARWLPPLVRGPAQGALLACGAIGVAAYPFVRGEGVTAGEPSFLARDYGGSVLVLWAAACAVALAVVVTRVVRGRRA